MENEKKMKSFDDSSVHAIPSRCDRDTREMEIFNYPQMAINLTVWKTFSFWFFYNMSEK